MGKAKTPKRNGHASGPYDRPSKNNIFKMNKEYGQHILKNPGVSDAIVQKAMIQPTDTVLEVGPGTGNLTCRALPLCRKLIAIEVDPRMAAEVTKRVQGTPEQKKLEVILGDVIKMDFPSKVDIVLSNTPYQISSPLIFKILELPNPPRVCTLMLQREFALRLIARPGDALRCRLSVNAQKWARITHIMKVSAKNFNPPPKVESSVVRIEPKLGRERPTTDYNEFDGLLRIVFSRKNKTLRASFLGTKQVLAMLEKNYRTYCSLNGIPLNDGVIDPDSTPNGEDDEMELDVDEEPLNDGGEDEWTGIQDAEMDDVPDFFKEMAAAATANTPAKTKSRRPKTKVGELVRGKIQRVLDSTNLSEQRASKIDETDFLRLLHEFNEEGIHFA